MSSKKKSAATRFWRRKAVHLAFLAAWVGMDYGIGRSDISDAAGGAASWGSFSLSYYWSTSAAVSSSGLGDLALLYTLAWFLVCVTLLITRKGRSFFLAALIYCGVQWNLITNPNSDLLGAGLFDTDIVEYLAWEGAFFLLALSWFAWMGARQKPSPNGPSPATVKSSV